eukprot:SAG22_NODE_2859_length_2151_cov_2.005848_3_plen_137_part_00
MNCPNACDPSKECPQCKKNGMRTFFCSNECFKGCWKSHKKLHKAKPDDLELVSSWGLSRPMAAEVLATIDLGNIAAVSSMANTDELVAIMALRKNDNDVGQAIMHLSGRDSEKRMSMPTQDVAMERVMSKLRGGSD